MPITTEYVIDYICEVVVDVSPAGAGEHYNNENVTLTATANSNYKFVNWTDANGTVISAENPLIFIGNSRHINNR